MMHLHPRNLANASRFARAAVLVTASLAGVLADAAVPLHGVRPAGSLGGSAILSLPSDVAVASDGRVFVVDSGHHRIVVFGRDGGVLSNFSGPGSDPGRLRDPVGLGIAPNGEVYVADKGNRRIQVFGPDGQFRRGFAVTSGGKSVAPVDVALDAAGKNVYVTGNSNHRVMTFTPEGRFLREWGREGEGRGEFRYPATVAVGSDGRVYVVDVLNTRVQVFEGANRTYQVGEWGVLPGQLYRPKGVALDGAGRVYVSDSYLDVVQVFDSAYRFLYVLGAGNQPHRVTSAGGIAVAGNRLYVAEMLKNRVAVIELSP